ncbi:hypothetical protein, partial [Iodidimonas gelatinilytica]|uniref:hypothetical protein n=1 Tax=Iodidimonas gelatinilytica TaxID=1236966 RepID=UPI001B2FEB6A
AVGGNGMRAFFLTYRLSEAGATYRVEVKIWPTGPAAYWRSVVISPLGDPEARVDARTMAETLEATASQ